MIHHFPFDTELFISDFEKQMNFINEANNIIYFNEHIRRINM